MSGTFSSLGSALSALRYHRVAMDTASGNIANASTAGYARRTATAQAVGAPAVPALWSRWTGGADGVETGGVERMVDPLLDARSRTEQGALSFLDTRAASLVRFETTLAEPGEGGIAAALAAFKQGWDDVANHPGDEAARSQLLGRAETLRSAVATQADALATEWSDQRTRIDAAVTETNQVAADLARLNGALQSAAISGTDAGTLLDQRDQLASRLAELTGARVVATRDTMFDVELDGVLLVSGTTAGSVALAAGTPTSMPGSTQESVTVTVTGPAAAAGGTGTPVGGVLGGTREVLNKDLPQYLAKLDAFVATLVSDVNAQHSQGFALDGTQPGGFFAADTATATGLTVLVTDPRRVAAGDGSATYDASVASRIAGSDLGGSEYRSLVTGFGVQVASARRVAENQAMLTAQVNSSRESLSGVNLDEEMVHLLAAQRAYEGAARVLTTLDSVLDTLINRTGLTR